ncbi:hypothetical protein V8E36_008201 [Tilletia maclaganii]
MASLTRTLLARSSAAAQAQAHPRALVMTAPLSPCRAGRYAVASSSSSLLTSSRCSRRWASTANATDQQASAEAKEEGASQDNLSSPSASSPSQLAPGEQTFAAETASDPAPAAQPDKTSSPAPGPSAAATLEDILGSALSTDTASPGSALASRSDPRLQGRQKPGPGGPKAPPHYRLHIRASRNNTILTFTKPTGETLASASGGTAGFKKSQRSGYEAGYRAAFQMFNHIADYRRSLGHGVGANPNSAAARRQGNLVTLQARGPDVLLETIWAGFGQGREAVFRAMMTNEGQEIRSLVRRLTDATPIKIGGVRPKKRRML